MVVSDLAAKAIPCGVNSLVLPLVPLEAEQWWKVKSHKALQVNEGCVEMACCLQLGNEGLPCALWLAAAVTLIQLVIAASF